MRLQKLLQILRTDASKEATDASEEPTDAAVTEASVGSTPLHSFGHVCADSNASAQRSAVTSAQRTAIGVAQRSAVGSAQCSAVAGAQRCLRTTPSCVGSARAAPSADNTLVRGAICGTACGEVGRCRQYGDAVEVNTPGLEPYGGLRAVRVIVRHFTAIVPHAVVRAGIETPLAPLTRAFLAGGMTRCAVR